MSRALKLPKFLNLVVGVMLLGTAVTAQGQPQAPPAPPAPAQPPGPSAPPPASVDISVPQRSTLTPQEMVGQSRDYRQKIQQTLTEINALLETAKKGKDIIKVNCLLGKQAEGKVNLNIADQAIVNLNDALTRRDDGGSLHEYTRITIVHQKAQVLSSEAQQCVGEDVSFVGATKVDVEVTGVPAGNFTDPAAPDYTTPGRPISASRSR